MNAKDERKQTRMVRGGIFWPLILISVGVIFLLRNTGVLSGDFLNSLLPFWPLILVLMGLDSIYRREGWIGSTLLITLGVVFLLSNLGYLALSVWQVLIRLWPLFLVAAGMDLLIGRRSWIGSLLGVMIILAILMGSLWVMGGGLFTVKPMPTSQLEQALEGINQARVEINQDAGSLQLKELEDNGLLLTGSGPAGEGLIFTKEYQVQDGKGVLVLHGAGEPVPFINTNQYAYYYQVNSGIPIDLQVNQGAGEVDLNLLKLDLTQLNVDQAVGQTTILLPEAASLSGSINGAIGQITILVPPQVGLKVIAGTALVTIQAPPDFQKVDKIYTSANFDQAQYQIELMVNLAIGTVSIVVQ